MCLQGNYTLAAEELIVHTYFFCGSRDVLPKVHTQQRTKIVYSDSVEGSGEQQTDHSAMRGHTGQLCCVVMR